MCVKRRVSLVIIFGLGRHFDCILCGCVGCMGGYDTLGVCVCVSICVSAALCPILVHGYTAHTLGQMYLPTYLLLGIFLDLEEEGKNRRIIYMDRFTKRHTNIIYNQFCPPNPSYVCTFCPRVSDVCPWTLLCTIYYAHIMCAYVRTYGTTHHVYVENLEFEISE